MIKFLAFLLILVILFGVAATRSLVFGAVSIVFWLIITILGVIFIAYIIDALSDKRTPEQKKRDEARQKAEIEHQRALAKTQRKEVVAKQQKWRKKHPKKAKVLDFITDHPAIFAVALTPILIAVSIGIVLLVSK